MPDLEPFVWFLIGAAVLLASWWWWYWIVRAAVRQGALEALELHRRSLKSEAYDREADRKRRREAGEDRG